MYVPALVGARKRPMAALGALVPNHAMQAVALERARAAVVHGLALAVLPGLHKRAVDRLAWPRDEQRVGRHVDVAHEGLQRVRLEPPRVPYVGLHEFTGVFDRHGGRRCRAGRGDGAGAPGLSGHGQRRRW